MAIPEQATSGAAVARLLPGQRRAILAGLAGVSAVAWLYLVVLAARMSGMDGMAQGGMTDAGMSAIGGVMAPASWTAADGVLMFAMWWVMMVGMMLPGAAPMILTFARVSRGHREQGQPYVPTAVFAAGYLVAWGGFSIAATAAQWGLEEAALMLPMMHTTSPLLGGGLFVLAGLYQLTPLKYACLEHCRSPFAFIINHWRDGTAGALRMGVAHGLFCLGCCWVLMALLFVGGVMNLLWVAAIAGFVLAEKVVPAGHWFARFSGLGMLAFGIYLGVAG